MASLIEQLLNKGPSEKEKKIKQEAEAATKQYEQAYGVEVPEEEGIQEADFLPDVSDETGGTEEFLNPETGKPERYPMLSGTVPAPSFSLSQLKKSGLPPERIKAIAQDVRMQGYSHLYSPEGKLIGTVGEMGEAGKELKKLSQQTVNKELMEAQAKHQSNLSKMPMPAKEKLPTGAGAKFMEKTGVNPRGKTALETIDEIQKKKKKELGE